MLETHFCYLLLVYYLFILLILGINEIFRLKLLLSYSKIMVPNLSYIVYSFPFLDFQRSITKELFQPVLSSIKNYN